MRNIEAETGSRNEIEQRAARLRELGYRETDGESEKDLQPGEFVIASRTAAAGSMYENRLEYVITWYEE